MIAFACPYGQTTHYSASATLFKLQNVEVRSYLRAYDTFEKLIAENRGPQNCKHGKVKEFHIGEMRNLARPIGG